MKKKDCCGCTACVSVCPKPSISMKADGEGCLYSEVDLVHCVQCGLCEKVCPILNLNVERKPKIIYAAKNNDLKIREESSSGGIFTLLAESVIKRGGVVFGAFFDSCWNVVLGYAETKEDLRSFRGAKYVQAHVGEAYHQTLQFLKAGRLVLFAGTPCQIAGLKHFLCKDYENLLTVDFICHGVPSPAIWQKYLTERIVRESNNINSVVSKKKCPYLGKGAQIEKITFRDKRTGWKKYSCGLIFSVNTEHDKKKTVSLFETYQDNAFMKAFLQDLSLRPSCYACPAKGGRSNSDLTIADFWGVEHIMPDFDDDKGISLVMSWNEQGNDLFFSLGAECRQVEYNDVLNYNSCLVRSVVIPIYRKYFFHMYQKHGFHVALNKIHSRRWIDRIMRRLYIHLYGS